MKNIWFLRMDKNILEGQELNRDKEYIHSIHGTCGDKELALRYANLIFPEKSISDQELSEKVMSIKKELIEKGLIDENQQGKRRCDVAIRYWVSVMQAGDIAFVRTRYNDVFLCEVTGYVSESFFKEHGCFQRPVKILQNITENDVHEYVWRRTQGRKTIERNAKRSVADLVTKYLGIV